jgi:hypothetical protein
MIHKIRRFSVLSLFLMTFLILNIQIVAQEAAKNYAGTSNIVIDPKVSALVKKMGSRIKNAKEFSFHAEVLYDDVLPSGQKLQFAAAQNVSVKRPDKVFVEYMSDVESREFWYNGKSVTLLDKYKNLSSSAETVATIDGTLTEIMDKYGYTPALSDFLYSDPYKILMKNVVAGFYVGLGDVNGTECHHLAFVEKYIDWQIWIETGNNPLARKLVITYKTVPDSPQYLVVFSDWNFDKSLSNSLFESTLPPGVNEINIVELKKINTIGEQ